MPEILRTRDMQGAARSLIGRYARTLIRAKTSLEPCIRFRRQWISDLSPQIVLNPKVWDVQLDAWNQADTGAMVYERAWDKCEIIMAHQAQLVVEAPFDIARLTAYAQRTREVVVVYLPPSWDAHLAGMRERWPTVDICKRFFHLTQAAEFSPIVQEVMEMKHPPRVISEDALAEALGVGRVAMMRIRDRLLISKEFFTLEPIRLRHPPDDRILRMTYDHIEEAFPAVDGVRYIFGRHLYKHTRNWRLALRTLERRGSIARLPTIGCYHKVPAEPNWKDVQADREAAIDRMSALILAVENAPALALPVPQRPQTALSRLLSARS